ncbi:hypothetical protein [Alteromonas halophila]|uniref:Uncharacterized protein n=1 Tax=Alteromonas halophila TaxID=516698 RepID=A0A918JG98_9ALTE|nr:hypothetical protein [Alteromonas halophila]GGW79523.1 hypothetical protein GCM10007391_10390 [Alteromonas halophila]
MRYVAFAFFCVCLTGFYYLLTMAPMEYTTVDELAGLLNVSVDDDSTKLARDVLMIALAGLIPAFLAQSYEPRGKWFCLAVTIAGTVFLHGNTGIAFWDPVGFERFINTYLYGDNPSGVTLAVALVLSPVIWLSIFTFAKPSRRERMWMHPD